MKRRGLALCCALALAACGPHETATLGIGARVTADRTEARVGDPIGITVEVETPEGFAIQQPALPSAASFASDAVEVVPPIAIPGGLRHHLLWTVRAREIGDQILPWVDVPVVRPDGAVQPLRIGGVPLAVRSVTSELPAREAVFDIRAAPPDRPTPLWVWVVCALAVALGWLSVRGLRRRARRAEERAGRVRAAGREALARLEGVESESDPKSFALRVRAPLLEFVGRIWQVETATATPSELPAEVDGEIVRLLGGLDAARFAPRPALAPLVPLAEHARERVRHVAELGA
jgi:hypothetical protein